MASELLRGFREWWKGHRHQHVWHAYLFCSQINDGPVGKRLVYACQTCGRINYRMSADDQ